jgi:conjugal transfer mating pair stabilization protein TraG
MGSSLNATAALQSYAYTRAQEQKRMTNQTVGDMASYWLPLIKNNLELLLYGSFIFVVLLSVFPFGMATLKSYIYTLVWVELWPPLYAVLNLTISYYAHKQNLAVAGSGINLQSLPGLLQVNSDIAGLAGYLSMSVPAVAGALLWGMHSILQLSQYVGGMTQSAAGAAATEAVTGNIGFGNTNFGNQSAFNTSNNHVDSNLRVSSGASMMQLSDGTQLSVMPNGSEVVNMGNTISNIGASIDFSKGFRTSFTQSADRATTEARMDQHHFSEATTSAMRNLYDIGDHINKGESSGNGWSLNTSSGVSKAFGEVSRITHDLADRLHISYNDAANLAANIYADGKTGLSAHMGISGSVEPGGKIFESLSPARAGVNAGADLSLSGGLGTSRTATHSSSTDSGSMYSAAKDFLSDQHYSENVDTINRASQDKSLRTNNEEGNRLVDSMASSLDKADSYRHDMQTNFQNADSYRENANKAEEFGARYGVVGQQEFVEWLSKQPGTDDRKTLGISSVSTIMRDPELRDKYLEKFIGLHTQIPEKSWSHGLPSSAKSLENNFHREIQSIPGESHIRNREKQNHESLDIEARSKGLIPHQVIDHTVQKQVESELRDKNNEITEKNSHLKNDETPIKAKFDSEKTQNRHGSLSHDFIHDINTKTDEKI